MASTVLETRGLRKSFGQVKAVDAIDLVIAEGGVHGIVGPNGAGKTSLLNLMSGYLRPDEGEVILDDRDITALTPQARVPLGLVRTFQNIRLFSSLSVRENLKLGQHTHARSGWTSLWPFQTTSERKLRAEVDHLVELFNLGDYVDRRAGDLPYGVQKQLDMARALAAHPRLLLLDEPAAGMPASGRSELGDRILQIRDEGVSVVVVEHDMDVIKRVCDTVTVLDFGQLLLSGTPRECLEDARVKEAYLG